MTIAWVLASDVSKDGEHVNKQMIIPKPAVIERRAISLTHPKNCLTKNPPDYHNTACHFRTFVKKRTWRYREWG